MRALPFPLTVLLFACLALCLPLGCGGTGSDDGGGGSGGALSGSIDGASWSVNAGYTDSFLSNDDGYYVVLLGNDDNGSCASPSTSVTAAKLQVRVPKTTGVYSLNAAANRELNVLIPPSTSLSIGTGGLEVLEVSASSVRGELTVSNQGVEIDGSFEAEICP